MKTPLLDVLIPSIYKVNNTAVVLPKRMARCTPDMKVALAGLAADLQAKGGKLILSDLFRSYDMQLGSHLDWKSGRKRAFSPPPGGSLHEAGRAMDLSLGDLKIGLPAFWPLAAARGVVPIIAAPNPRTSEAWHFECRGSHKLVQDYYKAGKGINFDKPYQAMAASAIVSIGVRVDKFGDGQDAAYVQSALIRLGQNIGNLDGAIGPKSRAGLNSLGIAPGPPAALIAALDELLEQKFPGEFFDPTPSPPFPFD